MPILGNRQLNQLIKIYNQLLVAKDYDLLDKLFEVILQMAANAGYTTFNYHTFCSDYEVFEIEPLLEYLELFSCEPLKESYMLNITDLNLIRDIVAKYYDLNIVPLKEPGGSIAYFIKRDIFVKILVKHNIITKIDVSFFTHNIKDKLKMKHLLDLI